jgi:hypothetical protein
MNISQNVHTEKHGERSPSIEGGALLHTSSMANAQKALVRNGAQR